VLKPFTLRRDRPVSCGILSNLAVSFRIFRPSFLASFILSSSCADDSEGVESWSGLSVASVVALKMFQGSVGYQLGGITSHRQPVATLSQRVSCSYTESAGILLSQRVSWSSGVGPGQSQLPLCQPCLCLSAPETQSPSCQADIKWHLWDQWLVFIMVYGRARFI